MELCSGYVPPLPPLQSLTPSLEHFRRKILIFPPQSLLLPKSSLGLRKKLPHPPRCSGQRPGGVRDNSLLCASPTSHPSTNPVGSDSKMHPHPEILTPFFPPHLGLRPTISLWGVAGFLWGDLDPIPSP